MSPDEPLIRCGWAGTAPEYVAYHDDEWGRVLQGDREMFERLSLEAFRSAFAGFDIATVAAFTEADVRRLMTDSTIVRNLAKIEATVANARAAVDLGKSLSDLVWSFAPEPGPPPRSLTDVPATTPESTALAKTLRRHGFRFVGPTTAHALMQATGMVNDHVADCWVRSQP